MTSTAAALFVSGALLELAGIVCVGSPDIVPAGKRFSAWLRRRVEPTANRLLRLLGRPRSVTVTLEPGVVRATGMPVYFERSIREGASLEERVEFLIRRDQEAQQRENDHEARLTAIEGETPEQLEEL